VRTPLISGHRSSEQQNRSASRPDLSDSESREEARAFLQQRVGSFALLLAAVFGMFLLWRLASAIFGDDSPSRAFLPWQALAVGTFLALGRVCRGRPRSYRFVRLAEFAGLLVAGSAATMMSFRISYAARPDAVLLLCLTYTLIARSIIVPSTARRTLLLHLGYGVPFVVSVYFLHRLQHDPSIYTAAADPRLRMDAVHLGRRWAVVAGLWWTAATIIATATSKVIYGLRQQVRDARRLGQYTLTEKLGEGGMGVVYAARHAMLRRPTAVKLLPPERFGPHSVARFEREVQLTASLSHPNTIRVFDYGRTPDGTFYYAMEYLEGANLAEVVAEGGAMPPGRVIHVLVQAAGALAEAHGIGLIHRDIKPANIFLTEQGGVPDVAKVLDFGLVKEVKQSATEKNDVTQTDALTGTPMYMAPESILFPDEVDARTDLYSLGAVGYFLVTGEDVFTGHNVIEVCGHHIHSVPVRPSERLGTPIAPDLEQLILSCLEKDPANRPASARALLSALRACADAESWSEEDARRWADAHGPALRARRSRGPVRSDTTIAVDFDERLGRRALAAP
jgi:hypothetical protein